MVFKNESQLKSFLLGKCRNAITNAQEKVYRIIDLYLQRYYADYDPVWYDRTYQLLHSLVKSDIRKEGSKVVATVYFDLDYIYNTGRNPSGEQVMNAAAYGGHGAQGLKVVYGSGEDTWYTPLEILDAEAINILRDMLIAEGIPIKKG